MCVWCDRACLLIQINALSRFTVEHMLTIPSLATAGAERRSAMRAHRAAGATPPVAGSSSTRTPRSSWAWRAPPRSSRSGARTRARPSAWTLRRTCTRWPAKKTRRWCNNTARRARLGGWGEGGRADQTPGASMGHGTGGRKTKHGQRKEWRTRNGLQFRVQPRGLEYLCVRVAHPARHAALVRSLRASGRL